MSKLVEDINPLDISFSNQKGFQISTPSQGSPSFSEKQSMSKVRTPKEVFDPEQTKQTKKIAFVPKSYTSQTARNSTKGYQSLHKKDSRLEVSRIDMSSSYAQMYETRYCASSHRRNYSGIAEPTSFYRSSLYESQLMKEKKRAQILKWNKIESSHLKQISRLNNLINKVTTHMTAFSRAYPIKRK